MLALSLLCPELFARHPWLQLTAILNILMSIFLHFKGWFSQTLQVSVAKE